MGGPATVRGAGSNVKGRAAGAAWTYLLDALRVRTVVCVGQPAAAARATLLRIADRLVVDGEAHGAQPADGGVDLVYLTREAVEAVRRGGRLLGPHGRLYVETRGGRRERTLRRHLADCNLHVSGRFWLSPGGGEARTAVPADDALVRRYFLDRGIIVSESHPLLRWIERCVTLMTPWRGRFGLIVSRQKPAEVSSRIPAYLVRLAAGHGVDLRAYRYGLAARGQYNSRKVIFYLFPPEAERPTLVVKTTRDAMFNDRLANEERVLRRLRRRQLVPPGTAPEVVFSGTHGGLRVVGETALEGKSLRSHPGAAASGYRWLTDLALGSAVRSPTAVHGLEERLAHLVHAVGESYALDEWERESIRRLADTVREHASDVPAVVSHGDAATWNALLLADGQIGFLDWEAGRSDGVPLWDLWYFARSRHMSETRVRRRLGLDAPDVLTAIARDDALRRAVAECVSRLGIPAEVIDPLFVLCWADRALREVTRLDAADLVRGHYIGLVRTLLSAQAPRPLSTTKAESL